MLNKIVKIANTGRFEDYNADGDVAFRKLNIVYGENGRGKTTLSAILRSLKTNNPSYVLERSTIRTDGTLVTPNIKILTGSGIVNFSAGIWDTTAPPNIEIFDSNFVNENVFSGEIVEHEHKKNLYRFLIGDMAVAKAQEVNKLNGEVNAKQTAISLKEAEIKLHTTDSISVENFIKLPALPSDHDAQIAAQEKEVETVKKSSTIISKPVLTKVTLPILPLKKLNELLPKQLENVAEDAEKKTLDHTSHLGGGSEALVWVQNGISYDKGSNCPFCGQNTAGSSLLSAYRGYFNLAYKIHKTEIAEMTSHFSRALSTEALSSVQRIFENNDGLIDFWKDYAVFTKPTSPFNDLKEAWDKLQTEITEHLKRKTDAPLEIINVEPNLAAALLEFGEIEKLVTAYNKEVADINAILATKKTSAGSGNLLTEQNKLSTLNCLKNRHTPLATELCNAWKKLRNEKTELEEKKRVAKDDLDSFDKTLLERFETSINAYLEKFGVSFRIAQTRKGYSGGTPSSSYCIEINGAPINLDGAIGEPSFKSILSDGDKSTLAFAFFLARLDQDANICDKVVIFDDPITSLDIHRKTSTQQEIMLMAAKAKQTIVMSHDLQFLISVWNEAKALDLKCLEVKRVANSSTIVEWDVAHHALNTYLRDIETLNKFADTGEYSSLIGVARCIRPVLEGYLRFKLPKLFLPAEWLGDLLSKMAAVNQADLPKSLHGLEAELSSINDYSKKYHHPAADGVSISEGELKSYVIRTLKVLGG